MRNEKPVWYSRSGLGCDPIAMHGAPVSFSAGVQGIAPGVDALFDTSALANDYRHSYWIDEIRMQVYTDSFDGEFALSNALSYAMGMQFRVGQFMFSQNPVPMGLYGPRYNETTIGEVYDAGACRAGSEVRWLLPKPLWMGPGDVIQARASRLAGPASAGAFTGVLANVDVTYVGRAAAPGAANPVTRHVPWVASYIHPLSQAYSRTGASGQNEFQNPFTVPLHVHRLVGKPGNDDTTNAGMFNGAVSRQGMMPVSSATSRWVSAYIDDSLAYAITGRFSSAASIFDTERNAWTFNRPIGPREQLNMQFQTNGSVDDFGVSIFGVGLIAHREES